MLCTYTDNVCEIVENNKIYHFFNSKEVLPWTESLLVVETNPLIPSSTLSVILPESVSDTPLIVSECCKPPSAICIMNLSLLTILCSFFNHQTGRGFEILHLKVVVAFSYTTLFFSAMMILQGVSNNNNAQHIKLMQLTPIIWRYNF